MHELRSLDVDDFLILCHLLDDTNLTRIGNKLCMCQPAISKRLKKITEVFGVAILAKSGRNLRLTNQGRRICEESLALQKILEGLRQPVTGIVSL